MGIFLCSYVSMPLLLPGEPEQTLPQCTVHTKDIDLFITNYLIRNNPQLQCTPTLTLSPPVALLAYCSTPPPEF